MVLPGCARRASSNIATESFRASSIGSSGRDLRCGRLFAFGAPVAGACHRRLGAAQEAPRRKSLAIPDCGKVSRKLLGLPFVACVVRSRTRTRDRRRNTGTESTTTTAALRSEARRRWSRSGCRSGSTAGRWKDQARRRTRPSRSSSAEALANSAWTSSRASSAASCWTFSSRTDTCRLSARWRAAFAKVG